MLHKLKLDKIISLTQQYFLPLNIPLEWLHGCCISEYSLMTALLEYLNSSYKVQIAEKRQSVAGLQTSPVSFRVFIVKCTELKLALIIVGCTVNSKVWKYFPEVIGQGSKFIMVKKTWKLLKHERCMPNPHVMSCKSDKYIA